MNKIVLISVSGFFADMINPENQGNNFNWNKFPKLAASYTRNQAVLAGVDEREILSYLEKEANLFANDLINRAGIK